MKIFTLAPNENWIVDRLAKEWNDGNPDIVTDDMKNSDIIWLLADWCHRHVPRHILSSRKIMTTVHHIVPEKFGSQERADFAERDLITDVYHCYNDHTVDFLKAENLTAKPIVLMPYWANQHIWRKTGEKYLLRQKFGLPLNSFIFGSFQRDTEGHDLKSPKLEKGPDLLADLIIKSHKSGQEAKSQNRIYVGSAGVQPRDYHVVLAGWRRQYIISRLEEAAVPYTYFEKPDQETLNELYQTLDLYPVTARHEGGPQSLLECGLLGVKVISRPVGIAEQVLPASSIKDDVFTAEASVPDVHRFNMTLPQGFEPYRKTFKALHEGKF